MARKGGQGALVRGSDVESSDMTVDAGSGDDRLAVFIPIVGQSFSGGELCGIVVRDLIGRMEGNGEL